MDPQWTSMLISSSHHHFKQIEQVLVVWTQSKGKH